MKSHEEAMEIFNKFGIQTELVEPTVYKVINNTQEFNIDDLEMALEEVVLLVSYDKRYVKNSEGCNDIYRCIYYIFLDYDNNDLVYKYDVLCKKSGLDAVINEFKYDPNYKETIDTIYSAEELGRA